MKQVPVVLAIILLFLSACKKDRQPILIVEPPPEKVISVDTLISGQIWGLAIGETASDIYFKIQNIRSARGIHAISIVGNVFTDLSRLENSIPLYNSVFLDQAKGTETGIQISFEENKVKSIWTNAGVKLNKWPANSQRNSSIAINDPVSGIHQRLINIKKIKAYENKFERISIFSKDLNKPYDSYMSSSPQWYFVSVVNAKYYYIMYLNFSAGKLVSVYSVLYEVL